MSIPLFRSRNGRDSRIYSYPCVKQKRNVHLFYAIVNIMSIFREEGSGKTLFNKQMAFWAVLAVLALVLSFYIGELYGKKNSRSPIIIEKCSTAANL